jgi:hypothetical protein
VLKYEAFTDSALARFLLRRALAAPRSVGHAFFWFLRAEMDKKDVADRCVLAAGATRKTPGATRSSMPTTAIRTRMLQYQ